MASETLLNELTALLRDEMALHEGLRDELRFEAAHDGRLDGRSLLALQQRKVNWVSRIESLEGRRMNKVGELARSWGEPSEQLTLSRIIERAPAHDSEGLQDCFDGLRALVDEIRTLARETGANAQARLKAIEATLSVIGEAAKLHPTYSGSGRLQHKPPTFKQTSA